MIIQTTKEINGVLGYVQMLHPTKLQDMLHLSV